MKYRAITPEELAALQRFKRDYGREWKAYLSAAWAGESYKGLRMIDRDGGSLRTLRNELGHAWLRGFKLPK